MALRLNQPVLALFAGLTIAAGAGGATADDHMAAPAADGLYGAIGGGATFLEDADNTGSITVESEFDPGFGVLGNMGYDWGDFRTELELSYREADIDRLQITNDNGLGVAAGVGSLNGLSTSGDGEMRAFAVMGNVLYDMPLGRDFVPYVGGGIGIADVKLDADALGARIADSSDDVLAYQGIAGVAYALTEQLYLFADYRYFATTDPELADVSGGAFDSEFKSHNVFAGLRFYFNAPKAPAPAPQPVATPAPPPPPAESEPETIPTFIVFFDWDRANIRSDAEGILRDAIAASGEHGITRIVLTGHADTSGPAAYNMGLSQRRADNVRQFLVANGIGVGDIATVAKGETSLLVPTPDGVREPQNRRVEIVLSK
ncbi:MAG: OmpA family protein [Alphaproteobacteria bacterium]